MNIVTSELLTAVWPCLEKQYEKLLKKQQQYDYEKFFFKILEIAWKCVLRHWQNYLKVQGDQNQPPVVFC